MGLQTIGKALAPSFIPRATRAKTNYFTGPLLFMNCGIRISLNFKSPCQDMKSFVSPAVCLLGALYPCLFKALCRQDDFR